MGRPERTHHHFASDVGLHRQSVELSNILNAPTVRSTIGSRSCGTLIRRSEVVATIIKWEFRHFELHGHVTSVEPILFDEGRPVHH